MSEFSKRLTGLRENKGWSKTYVAKAIGLSSMQTYANWEYGRTEAEEIETVLWHENETRIPEYVVKKRKDCINWNCKLVWYDRHRFFACDQPRL